MESLSHSKHLVVGMGEVGKAIFALIADAGMSVSGIDKDSPPEKIPSGPYDVLHVCFPYSKFFVSAVETYQREYMKEDALVIIHSTVPVGTTIQIENAVHSPIRGVHPNLKEGILTFTKYVGGKRSPEAALYIGAMGVPNVLAVPRSENTEALKLWDTTYYGWNIIFQKILKEYCDEHGLDFDLIYTDANMTYNAGYLDLGRPEVQRPVLAYVPGKIGGHCVIENCELLASRIAKVISVENDML